MARLRGPWTVLGLGLVLLVLAVPPRTYGQVDTTRTAPADTGAVATDTTRPAVVSPDTAPPRADTGATNADTVRAPAGVPADSGATATRRDTTDAPRDTARTAARRDPEPATLPETLVSFPTPPYGRPVTDSLPAVTSHVGVEHMLAQQPGSFLYDLGAVGWPHGWSPNGLGPHRARLWVEDVPYTNPLTGRARFDLLPVSFFQSPRVGVDPGGAALGVHTAWREYGSLRPLTELRFRSDSNGQRTIEVGHSQKHRLSLFGAPGVLHATIGYGGRSTKGAYLGSDLRRERRFWGRLRYQRGAWAVEIRDFASRHRVGLHSGVTPPTGRSFASIYRLPFCEACSQNRNTRRRTYRNDLTARLRAPLLPGGADPLDVSATWTSTTVDFEPNRSGEPTRSVVLDGGHGSVEQSVAVGPHALTLGARGSVWTVERSTIAPIDGARWSGHAFVRDSVAVGPHRLVLDAGWHAGSDQQYPSASVQWRRPVGGLDVSAAVTLAGQQRSWFDVEGVPGFVEPLSATSSVSVGRVLHGRVGVAYERAPVDVQVEVFAHQIRRAVDLYAPPPPAGQRLASSDSVVVRQTEAPVRRVGATATVGWRRATTRGLYATGTGTVLRSLNADASRLHTRLSRTLPTVYGRGRVGARFVIFKDLKTDLYVQARGWTAMNSRWFHPPTGRLVVPPAATPIPARGAGVRVGPSGTVDLHAEMKLRGATLFFTMENVQSSFAPLGAPGRQATITPGTFVVPVYPLPARQFRFGVHWPIFD